MQPTWAARVMTLNTPFGGPASVMMRPSANVVHGVYVAGLMTMVQPVASAGAIFQVASSIGKFHGVMMPTTPTGSLRIRPRASSTMFEIAWPLMFIARPA